MCRGARLEKSLAGDTTLAAMIITELTDQVELEMDALVGQGITSFKLFMNWCLSDGR